MPRALRSCLAASASTSVGADADRAGGDARPALGVSEQGERDRGLAGARLADEADDLAGRESKRDVVDDLVAVGAQLHAQARDARRAVTRRHRRRSTPATARETPSVMKFVPIAKRAMQSAGARTAHGWTVMPPGSR